MNIELLDKLRKLKEKYKEQIFDFATRHPVSLDEEERLDALIKYSTNIDEFIRNGKEDSKKTQNEREDLRVWIGLLYEETIEIDKEIVALNSEKSLSPDEILELTSLHKQKEYNLLRIKTHEKASLESGGD